MPTNDFIGDFHVNNLIAENKQGIAVRWQQGLGRGVTGKIRPFFTQISELILQEPIIKLASAEEKMPAALFSLLRTQNNKPVFPPFTVDQCLIRKGTVLGKDDKPQFSEVQGSIAPMKPATETLFDLSGEMNGGDFSIKGRIDGRGSTVDEVSNSTLSH